MQIVKPREITGKILTVIEESKKELFIVTPYIDIRDWTKVRMALERAIKRGVAVRIYIREGVSIEEKNLDDLDLHVLEIVRLHAKLYLSEKAAVFTSMNLIKASDDKSLDLGIFTENPQYLLDFKEFIELYLDSAAKPRNKQSKDQTEIEQDALSQAQDADHDCLGKALNGIDDSIQWGDRNTYWFCRGILPFGDVMVDTSYLTWKLCKSRAVTDEFAEQIASYVKSNSRYSFDIDINAEHPRYIYVSFALDGNFNVDVFPGLVRLLKAEYESVSNAQEYQGY